MKVGVLIPAPVQAQVLDRWREAGPAGPYEILVCGPREGDLPSVPHLRWVEAGPDQALQRGLEAATGEVLLLMAGDTAPGPGLVEAHGAFHQMHAAPFEAACGPVGWDAALDPTPVMTHLRESSHGRLRDGDRVGVRLAPNSSVKTGWLRQAGRFDPRLDAAGQCALMARRLVPRGLRMTFLERAGAVQVEGLSNDEYLAELVREGRRHFALYGVEPDALPHVTLRYGARLALRAGRNGRLPDTPQNLLSSALQGGAVDVDRLARLREVCWFDGFCRAAGPAWLADPGALPLLFHQAAELARTSADLALDALRELQDRSPLVVGQARVRLMLKLGRFDHAAQAMQELMEPAGHGCWPELQLLSGEIALAVGELDLAEQAFAGLYESCRRPIDSAWDVCRLYRRYGPAPAARPHLERILGDTAGRSGADIRELIEPAAAWSADLP